MVTYLTLANKACSWKGQEANFLCSGMPGRLVVVVCGSCGGEAIVAQRLMNTSRGVHVLHLILQIPAYRTLLGTVYLRQSYNVHDTP